jgi:hypothetical protein
MSETGNYVLKLLEAHRIPFDESQKEGLNAFAQRHDITEAYLQIRKLQEDMIEKWRISERVDRVLQKQIYIPNATAGKPYSATLSLHQQGLDFITRFEIDGLEHLGLLYNPETETISGIPHTAGDAKITIRFKIEEEAEESPLNEKKVAFVVNPDPKSLWKNLPSNQEDLYAKKDEDQAFSLLVDQLYFLGVSKRGRAHANVGSFRDDDFAFTHYSATAWNVVALADGAGSSKYSRKGSQYACQAVVEYFETALESMEFAGFEGDAAAFIHDPESAAAANFQQFAQNQLLKAAQEVQNRLFAFIAEHEQELKDFHTTLIFVLFKKIHGHYLFLSFGVGDCPIAVLNEDLSRVFLLNKLDVGEYGGGTRFITMPEIFEPEQAQHRVKALALKSFSYLVLQTDGIYDPKFEVEANLEKIAHWQAFMADLKGQNDEPGVDFSANNQDIVAQLSAWMDFWSVGNHDDRTLAIVFQAN